MNSGIDLTPFILIIVGGVIFAVVATGFFEKVALKTKPIDPLWFLIAAVFQVAPLLVAVNYCLMSKRKPAIILFSTFIYYQIGSQIMLSGYGEGIGQFIWLFVSLVLILFQRKEFKDHMVSRENDNQQMKSECKAPLFCIEKLQSAQPLALCGLCELCGKCFIRVVPIRVIRVHPRLIVLFQ